MRHKTAIFGQNQSQKFQLSFLAYFRLFQQRKKHKN